MSWSITFRIFIQEEDFFYFAWEHSNDLGKCGLDVSPQPRIRSTVDDDREARALKACKDDYIAGA